MKAESVYFKGDICFKNDWVGFETIKPINVIIGRNNSGKSQFMDLVKVLCESHIESTNWEDSVQRKTRRGILTANIPRKHKRWASWGEPLDRAWKLLDFHRNLLGNDGS